MRNRESLSAVPGGAVEGELIEESRWGAIRALRERGMSKRGIARQLDLDIKTVRKWLQEEWRQQKRRKRGRALDDWREFLRCRAPEVGFNAEVLHRELRARGYEGSYPTVARYIRPWREAYLRELSPPTVRFETAPGKQAQVDWGSSAVWLGLERCRVHLFVMVLGYSRRLFARGYRSEGLESLLDAHARAFAHFGGRTETILGLKACALGYRTLFATAATLIGTLVRFHQENRLDEKLKQLTQPKLLILDEIGYLPLDRLGANLFFQLVSRRYERGSILLTSNQSLTGWAQIFGDQVIATAILDRLLHHSTILNIKGESYRLKEKRKSGLLTRSEPFTQKTAEDDSA